MNEIIKSFSEIDDGKIKKLIERYQNNEAPISTVIEYLTPLIYSYPHIIAGLDEDSCSDYFEYLLTRMEKVISSYRVMDYKFMTWFSVVLRRQYYNWLKSKKNQIQDIPILNAPIDGESGDELISFLAYEEYRSTNSFEELENMINTLPAREKTIMKLHYFSFFKEENLFELSEIFSLEFQTVLKKYQNYCIPLEQREQKIYSIQEKLGLAYQRLQKLRENRKHNEIPIDILDDLNKGTEIAEKLHNNTLESLKKSFLSLKHEEIADLTGLSVKNVANTLYRGKQLLKEKILNQRMIK